MDLLTCDYDLSEKGKAKADNLFKRETGFLESITQKKTVFKGCNIDKEFAWYDGILPNRLEVFCQTLFDLSVNFH